MPNANLSADDPDLRATAAAYVGEWLGFVLTQGEDGTHLGRILIAQLEHEDHPAVQDEIAHALLWGLPTASVSANPAYEGCRRSPRARNRRWRPSFTTRSRRAIRQCLR